VVGGGQGRITGLILCCSRLRGPGSSACLDGRWLAWVIYKWREGEWPAQSLTFMRSSSTLSLSAAVMHCTPGWYASLRQVSTPSLRPRAAWIAGEGGLRSLPDGY
jgi:hypothetical protein